MILRKNLPFNSAFLWFFEMSIPLFALMQKVEQKKQGKSPAYLRDSAGFAGLAQAPSLLVKTCP
jgi:hypothetical protein